MCTEPKGIQVTIQYKCSENKLIFPGGLKLATVKFKYHLCLSNSVHAAG